MFELARKVNSLRFRQVAFAKLPMKAKVVFLISATSQNRKFFGHRHDCLWREADQTCLAVTLDPARLRRRSAGAAGVKQRLRRPPLRFGRSGA